MKPIWLLVDIGDVLLLKERTVPFSQLLADELEVDIRLAQEINAVHYTTMEVKYISEESFTGSLKNNLGYDAPKDIFSYFARAYEKQVRPNTEFMQFLDEMRTLGIRTAVLSNTTAIYRDIQEKLGISAEKGFDPIVYSWEVELTKPQTEIFELALKKLRARPEEIIFIDDKLGHLEGAKQVGMRTLLFDDTDSVIEQLRRLCSSSD